jgi:exonuclease VII large subunit
MLARIKSAVTPEPELTPEELARAEEMKQELAAKEQEIIKARQDKAEREHREEIAKRNAELDEMTVRVDALLAQQTETNERELAKLGPTTGYVPSTTEALKAYERPKTWAKW